MKLLTFDDGSGPRAGVVVDGDVVDAAALLGSAVTLRDVRAVPEFSDNAVECLQDAIGRVSEPKMPLTRVTLCAPILQPPTVRDHIAFEEHASGQWTGESTGPAWRSGHGCRFSTSRTRCGSLGPTRWCRRGADRRGGPVARSVRSARCEAPGPEPRRAQHAQPTTPGGVLWWHPWLHAAFEVKDWQDLMRGVFFLGEHGARRMWGPCRHLAGNNLSSYYFDPEGTVVEYTTDVEQIKNDDYVPPVRPMIADRWGSAPPVPR